MTKTQPKSAPKSAHIGTEADRSDDYLTDDLDIDDFEIAAGDNLGIAGVLSAIDGLYGEIDKLAMADGRGPLSAVAVEQLRAAGGAAASLLRTDKVAHGLDRVAGAAGARRPAGATETQDTEANGGTPDAGPIMTREFELWLAASMG